MLIHLGFLLLDRAPNIVIGKVQSETRIFTRFDLTFLITVVFCCLGELLMIGCLPKVILASNRIHYRKYPFQQPIVAQKF